MGAFIPPGKNILQMRQNCSMPNEKTLVGVCMVYNSREFGWCMNTVRFGWVCLVYVRCTVWVSLVGTWMAYNSAEFGWCINGVQFRWVWLVYKLYKLLVNFVGVWMVYTSGEFGWCMNGVLFGFVWLVYAWFAIRVSLDGVWMVYSSCVFVWCIVVQLGWAGVCIVCNFGEFGWCMFGVHFGWFGLMVYIQCCLKVSKPLR